MNDTKLAEYYGIGQPPLSTMRRQLEQLVREHTIRRLATLLHKFYTHDPVYKEIKKDIRSLVMREDLVGV